MSYVPPVEVLESVQKRYLDGPILALWQIVLDQTVEMSPAIAVVNHDALVTVDDVDYEPWPIVFDTLRETTDGSTYSMSLTIGNHPYLARIVDENNALRGMPVELLMVHRFHVATENGGKPYTFTVEDAAISDDAITIKCASVNLADMDLPWQRIQGEACGYGFKSRRCGYHGPEVACDKSPERCTEIGVAERAAGQPSHHPERWGARAAMPARRRRAG